jgi:hypothetical protein
MKEPLSSRRGADFAKRISLNILVAVGIGRSALVRPIPMDERCGVPLNIL